MIVFKVSRYQNKPEHVTKTFRMPAELVEQLEMIANEADISLNRLVIKCCEYALDNQATSR